MKIRFTNQYGDTLSRPPHRVGKWVFLNVELEFENEEIAKEFGRLIKDYEN